MSPSGGATAPRCGSGHVTTLSKVQITVVTSGHGGVFPPNLPIGVVTEASHGVYGIVPIADLGRVNYVRLVDFNLKGGAFNPVATRIQAETKKH